MSNSNPSWLYSGNADFIEDLYEDFLRDPGSVSAEWRDFFSALQQNTEGPQIERAHSAVRNTFLESAKNRSVTISQGVDSSLDHQKQVSVLQLINAYRFRGHQQATLDPLNQHERPSVSDLNLHALIFFAAIFWRMPCKLSKYPLNPKEYCKAACKCSFWYN